MANERVTELASAATVHSDDWLVCVDTHDTSMDPTGTTKKLAPSVLSAALTIAESQVTNLTSDLAAKAADSQVVHLTGNETIAGTKTFSTAPVLDTLTGLLKASSGVLSAAGSADLPTITLTGNVTGAASGGSIATTIPAGTITSAMQANVAATALRGNPTGSPAAPSDVTLGPNLAFVGSTLRSRVPLAWVSAAGTAVANTTTLTSLFTGATIGGSLTIPANLLQVGSYLRFELFGPWGCTATPTLTVQITLGGVIILQGTSGAIVTASGNQWLLDHLTGTGALVQAIGTSGKVIGLESFALTGGARWGLNASGTQNAAPTQATINTTGALAMDVKVQWSAASASNTIQLSAAAIYLDF